MKNVVHDLSELRKILQRFETVFVCLFGSPGKMSSLSTSVLVSEERKFSICVFALTLNTSVNKCVMNASVSLKFELHSTLMFTEAVQKFSKKLFTHVKPVKINAYCLLTNEFNLNLRLYDACSTKPTLLDCTYSVLFRSRIKKRQTKQKPKTKPEKKNILAWYSCVFHRYLRPTYQNRFSQVSRDRNSSHWLVNTDFNPINERAAQKNSKKLQYPKACPGE